MGSSISIVSIPVCLLKKLPDWSANWSGKARSDIGVSPKPGMQTIRRAYSALPLAAVQSEDSMVWRQPEEELLHVLEEPGIGVISFSTLGKGFVTGRFDKSSSFDSIDFRSIVPPFSPENLDANQVPIKLIGGIAAEKTTPPAQIALIWVLIVTGNLLSLIESGSTGGTFVSIMPLLWI